MNVTLKQSMQLAAVLSAGFPEAFPKHAKQPLAVGIRGQIADAFPTVPVAVLNLFLRYWTRRYSYRSALATVGAVRVNLDGSIQGCVSEADAEFAKQALKEFHRRNAARRHSLRQAAEAT